MTLLAIEAGVALAIFLVVTGFAVVTLRSEHVGGEVWRVRAGAAITGAVLGGVIGFAIVPLRMALIDGGPGAERAAPFALLAFGAMVLLRRGAAARLPIIGPAVRAYRMAMLRRTIDQSQKQLRKLEAKTTPSATE